MTGGFLISIVLCVGLSFFLSGMEAGVFALSRVRIRRLLRAGNTNAERLHRHLENPEDFLWTILAGNTLANFGAATLVVIGSKDWLLRHPGWFAAAFLFGALVFYATCELLPKMLFRLYPNRLCLWLSWPFGLLNFLLRPLVALLRWLAAGLLRWSGGRTFGGRLFGTREELKVMMQEQSAELSSEEKRMINRVLDLQNNTVSHILVPMTRAAAVSTDTTVAEATALCRERGFSRLPVWSAAGANRRVVGMFHLKSLLYRDQFDPKRPVGEFLQPAAFVDADMRLEQAMRHLQRAGRRLAIVLGRDGRELGLVSLQDILKAIFGEVKL